MSENHPQKVDAVRPHLWNPNVAANWSLVLTPAFGAYLHAANWRALGRPDRAVTNMAWVWATLAFLAVNVGTLFMPDPKAAGGAMRLAGVGLLLGWYCTQGRLQARYVQEALGDDYVRKGWGLPLLSGVACVGAYLAVFLASAPAAHTPDPEELAAEGDADRRETKDDRARLLFTLGSGTDRIVSLWWSPDSRALVSRCVGKPGTSPQHGCSPSQFRLWDAETGRGCGTQSPRFEWARIAFAPDSRTVATWGQGELPFEEGTVTLWDVATFQERASLKLKRLSAVVFAPDGKTLATASVPPGPDANAPQEQTGLVTLWDVATGKARVTKETPQCAVIRLEFSPDGRTLAIAERRGRDEHGDVALCDPATGRERLRLDLQGRWLQPSLEGPQRPYRVPVMIPVFTGFPDRYEDELALREVGERGAVRMDDEWPGQAAAARKEEALAGEAAFALSPDGTSLYTWSHQMGLGAGPGGRLGEVWRMSTTVVSVWDPASGGKRFEFSGPDASEPLPFVTFAPDGKTLAAGWYGGPGGPGATASGGVPTIKLWDVATGQERAVIRGDAPLAKLAFFVGFAAGGRVMVSARKGGSAMPQEVKLWDVDSGRERATIAVPASGLRSLSFAFALSPDGMTLAAGCTKPVPAEGGRVDYVRLWDVMSAKECLDLPTGPVWSMAFLPDGRRLATAGVDGTVKLWDVAQAQASAKGRKSLRPGPLRVPAARTAAAPDQGDRSAEGDGGAALRGKVAERLQAATVYVEAAIGPVTQRGSGFLFRRESGVGYVVSNYHVAVQPVRPLGPAGGQPSGRLLPPPEGLPGYASGPIQCVFQSGAQEERSVPATVVALDEDRDLAILRVELRELPTPVDLDDRAELAEKLPLFIVGFPYGDAMEAGGRRPQVTISRGCVSGLRRDECGRTAVVQIGGDLDPGSSGGPVVDAKGRLLGVALATEARPQGGTVIPAEKLSEMLHGRIAQVSVPESAIDAADGVARVAVEVRLIDPLRQIQSVSVHYVRDDTVEQALKPDPKGLWPRLPGAQAAELEVAGDGTRAEGRFAVACQGPGDVVFSFQIALARADGVLVYSEPGRFTARVVERSDGQPASGGPGDGRAREPAAEIPWRPPRVTVVTPPPETVVTGRLELDSRGRPHTALAAQGVELDLGKDLRQVVACPTGKVVYAIRRDQPAVVVLDPLTWKTIAEFAVPESPRSVWADTELIAVACDKSRVVVLLDAQTYSLIAWDSPPELRGCVPETIIGRAPDGSIMSLWDERAGDPESSRLLVHIAPNGRSWVLRRNDGPRGWAMWLPDGAGLVMGAKLVRPGPRLDDPQGPLRFQWLDSFRDRLERAPSEELSSLIGGSPFLTSDRKALVCRRTRLAAEESASCPGGYRPDESIEARYTARPNRRSPGLPWTYLVSPALDRVLREFPGSAVVELPAQRRFVTVGNLWIPPQAPRGPWGVRTACYYVSSQDGGVVREITLQWPTRSDGRPAAAVPLTPDPGAVFVPGHEILLLPDPAELRAPRLPSGPVACFTYTAFRCGPVADDAAGAPGSLAPTNEPRAAGPAGAQ